MKTSKAIGQDELYPIYGIIKKPFWQTGFFKITIFSIFLLILFLAVYMLVRKLKKRRPKISDHERALLALENLGNSIISGGICSRDFYIKLTEILKQYMFGRFSYDLFGLTDNQMIKFLEDNNFDHNLLENIKIMLLSVQVVKFANSKAAMELMIRDLDFCKNLVSLTADKKLASDN